MKGSETPPGACAAPPRCGRALPHRLSTARCPAAVSCQARTLRTGRSEGRGTPPQHLHSFLVCVCVVRFIRKSPYVFPLEPLCLWKCSYIQEKDVCAGLYYGQLGTVSASTCVQLPECQLQITLCGKSIKLEKVLLVGMLKYQYIKYCFVSAWL